MAGYKGTKNRKRKQNGGASSGWVIVFLIVVGLAWWHPWSSHLLKSTTTAESTTPAGVSTTPKLQATATGSPIAGATGQYTLVQHPDAGFTQFYSDINNAKTSIQMNMYELSDMTAEQDLVAAHKRGVNVQVLLDKAYRGSESNAAAYTYLSANGVSVKWDNAGYIYHIKTTVFDGKLADISTGNLTSKYYGTGRDAEIFDTNPTQVAAIQATFKNDWAGMKPADGTVQAAGLVWSPGAEDDMVAQIAAAKKTVSFTSEELADATVYNALAADAKRGVKCEVVLTYSSDWKAAFTTLAKAGCDVRTYKNSTKTLYIHEKIVLDDAGTADASLLIGSQNDSVTSLTKNRELGVHLTQQNAPAVLNAVSATFNSDFNGGTKFTG